MWMSVGKLHADDSVESEAFVAPKGKPSRSFTDADPQPPSRTEMPAQPATCNDYAQRVYSQQPTSFMPSVPDAEEQEALSQLLLAWYQAGYAAGRYATIRQKKLWSVCCNKDRSMVQIRLPARRSRR